MREKGSGNAGTTNMLRNYGKGMAALTIIGDMAKVVIAIQLATIICSILGLQYSFEAIPGLFFIKCFTGFFCVLGHIFPVFFKFKAERRCNERRMVFMVDWRIALILLAVFIIVVLITKYVSLGSLIMAALYPILIYAFHRDLSQR